MEVPEHDRVVHAGIGPIWREGTLTLVQCLGPGAARGVVKELFDVTHTLNGEQPGWLLIDIRRLTSSDALSREHAVSATVGERVAAMALVVASPVTRVIGSFFIRINQPPYPVALFSDVETARAWLAAQSVDRNAHG